MNEKFSNETLENVLKKQYNENCAEVSSDIGTIKCNFCGYESKLEFLHYGRRHRTNEKCPMCSSLKRTRLVWYYLNNYTDLLERDDLKILQTSPPGSIYKAFKERYSDNYIASNIEEGEYVDQYVDIQDIPFEDNTFDLIISSHVLEHVPDDKKALQEFYRVLKPNGLLLVLVPSLYSLKKTFELPQINTPELRARYYKQFDHLRYYSVDSIFDNLENTGFTIDYDNYRITKSNPKDTKKYSLAEDPLFIGIKKEKEEKVNKKSVNLDTHCVICDKEVTFNTNNNLDKICPECKSNSDERLMYNYIKSSITGNKVNLYINPKNIKKPIQKFTTDFSEHVLKEDNEFAVNVLPSLKTIPSNSIENILAPHLLDQSIDDEDILKELTRIIKTNGKLLLKENIDLELYEKIDLDFIDTSKLRGMFYGNENALRCYGNDLINTLETMRYNVEYDDPEEQIDNLKLKCQLIKDPLLVCTKK